MDQRSRTTGCREVIKDARQPGTDEAGLRDWVKAALLIAVIVAVIILVFMAGIGQFSHCGTNTC